MRTFTTLTTAASKTTNSLPASDFLLYPNPTSGTLNIAFEESPLQSQGQVNIYNMIGQQILQITLNPSVGNFNHVLDVSSLPAGLYILRFTSDERIINRQFTVR
jgi:hypothetical protein